MAEEHLVVGGEHDRQDPIGVQRLAHTQGCFARVGSLRVKYDDDAAIHVSPLPRRLDFLRTCAGTWTAAGWRADLSQLYKPGNLLG
ncbi:hypothetical protein GCM10009637_18250 [Brevibacterium luteolum]